MSKKQPQTKIDALLSEYSALDRDIRSLTILLVGMIFMAAMFTAWNIVKSDAEATWRTAQIVGVLVSALIISKTASRHICHAEVVRKDESDISVVQRTHQALAVIADLRQRVLYVKDFLQNSDKPLIALSRNVKSIETHYQFFYDRSLYELLSPNAVEIIGSMSGTVFGLCTLAEALEHDHGLTASVSYSNAMHNSSGMQESIDSLLNEIESLDGEIREIRGSIGR